MVAHARGRTTARVDLLICGCEVSLWVGEQFASDLHNAFPKLKVVTISREQDLGPARPGVPDPAVGLLLQRPLVQARVTRPGAAHLSFRAAPSPPCAAPTCSRRSRPISSASPRSGTRRWRASYARAVGDRRPEAAAQPRAFVFTTFGCRPAEPCSLSVAATHQLLTQLLLYLMYSMRATVDTVRRRRRRGGRLRHRGGAGARPPQRAEPHRSRTSSATPASRARARRPRSATRRRTGCCGGRGSSGRSTSSRVLIVWIIHRLTVVAIGDRHRRRDARRLLVDAATAAAAPPPLGCTLDDWTTGAGFLQIAACVGRRSTRSSTCSCRGGRPSLLRLVQRRPWHHRVAGRSLLIGDVPWVAQSLEAFVSKCFALSYSIATVGVASANPLDHLVHRHTHRVVRGALLAVGRPDGRLNALPRAENTSASRSTRRRRSRTWASRCESFTLGHNPFKLGLTAAAITCRRSASPSSRST